MLLSQEQTLVHDALRAFAREQLAPHAARSDRESHFPHAELRALGEVGALGMVVPERWGGAAMDYITLAVALEEIAAGDGATERIYRDVRVCQVYEGTSDIQRMVIGRSLAN